MRKRGISLIVLIVTIIVIIILAAVILILSKNNPIESAKEAVFKEDIRTFQDELAMYIAKEYTSSGGQRDGKISESDYNKIKDYIPSFSKKYEGKFIIQNDGLMYQEDSLTKDEKDWIPSTESEYVKDTSFPNNSNQTGDDTVLSVLDETLDVKKYGGFYIGRYEATIPEGTSSAINTTAKPTCQSGKIVWTDINYTNSKASAESMYIGEESSVQSGLLTGKAWDRTCHWISDYKIKVSGVEEILSLTDSRKYGNFKNSESPANIGKYTSNQKQFSGANDNWKTKNIYDLAGNVWEWTYEAYSSNRICRGGGYSSNGFERPVTYRNTNDTSSANDHLGFRLRLYIKTN